MTRRTAKTFERAEAVKPGYASEVMLRVSWSVLNHPDGQPQHIRRGEVMLDLGLESNPNPELTREEMQRVAFAAKIAALKALAARPKSVPSRRIRKRSAP